MFPADGKASKKSRIQTANTETEPEAIDIFVDIIIGFMEKSTAYMRALGNQAFSLLSGSVQGTTIALILSVRLAGTFLMTSPWLTLLLATGTD
jgi:DNA polymerase phi